MVDTLLCRYLRRLFASLILCIAIVQGNAHAVIVDSHVKSREELEHGLVLFEYYQNRFFAALVENAYAEAIQNPIALSDSGEVLKGGLMLSYGMADQSRELFEVLLDQNATETVRNRAWYFLARFYYNKSDMANANRSLNQIRGSIPKDLHFDYHYLKTLVGSRSQQSLDESRITDKALVNSPQFPYLLFNHAIGQLRQGDFVPAVQHLTRVTQYAGREGEYGVLADRAKLGLAQLAMRTGRMPEAWTYLTEIRTTGLYSNRALLNYAWAAIKTKRFPDAIAALQLLNGRSIASPEVQESKVLLSHLYEQEGSPRKALKANLLAIKDFQTGVDMVAEARRIIDKKDVPEEFITNMEAIMDDSDWHSATPDVDYTNLTPFLIDLMASHPFHETLKELADLYAVRQNLFYWLRQADEHLIIINNSTKKAFDEKSRQLIAESGEFNARFANKKQELNLMNLSLEEDEQERVDILLESTAEELALLDQKVVMFQSLESVYTAPSGYRNELLELHRRIRTLLQKTELNIVKMEPVMRSLVKTELDKHEERMNYYWAQSRLAKARLYDTTLSTLKDAQREVQSQEN